MSVVVSPEATANCSDEPEPFVALSDSQQEHLVQLVIGGVSGEIQLVETARHRQGRSPRHAAAVNNQLRQTG